MTRRHPGGRPGITLTEILISIMILGIGMVSLATLFPVGLLRIRASQQASLSVMTAKQAVNDISVRNLLDRGQFLTVYPVDVMVHDPYAGANAINRAGTFGTGLPFAYDPLWWSLTGQPLSLVNFRFGNGALRPDNSGSLAAAANGLQRISSVVPGSLTPQQETNFELTFASPDNPVTQADNGVIESPAGAASLTGASPLVPGFVAGTTSTMNDYNYSWMFTGKQSDANDFAAFDGSIVVFNNRPFGTDANGPSGERVVEAVFAPGKPSIGGATFAYSTNDPRVVQLRWSNTQPDPDVAVGSWLADVTYEANANSEATRNTAMFTHVANGAISPQQRCFWYQVARRSVADNDPITANLRLMTVTLSTPVRARTLLLNDGSGTPAYTNAALLCPSVVNVFPRTFYNRR